MIAPVLYIPCAVLFWGWQMETLWMAVPMSALLLYARQGGSKFDFKAADFNKFVDVSIILVAVTIVLGLTLDPKEAIWMLLKWLPAVLFPITAAQQFSTAGRIEVRSFFLTARRRVQFIDMDDRKVDVSFVYVLLCVLSTGANIKAGYLFFPAVAFFSIWALWPVRSERLSSWIWICLVVSALGFAYIGQKGVLFSRFQMGRWMMLKYQEMRMVNPYKSHSALGEIGHLKLSGKIVIRAAGEVDTGNGGFLIQDGVYNTFLGSNWYARSPFSTVLPDETDTFWQVNRSPEPGRDLKLYSRPVRNKAVLALPPGTMRLEGFEADRLQRNDMQVIRVDNPPSLIVAKAGYTGRPEWDREPYKADLRIPEEEAAVMEQVVSALALSQASPEQIETAVRRYFLNGFSYSLDLKGRGSHETALQNFLLTTRQGHCELFAKAAVLMFRKAGIPARYVTGFIVHEYSDLEKKYLVRERDAHAWTRVFINGQWHDVDTTPPGFTQVDARYAPVSSASDFLSLIRFRLSQLRHETGKAFLDRYGVWLVLPLIIILVIRLRQSSGIKRVKEARNRKKNRTNVHAPGSFYSLEHHFSQKGLPRFAHETYFTWLERVRSQLEDDHQVQVLKSLVAIHNRITFGTGVTPDEKAYLYRSVKKITG